MRNIILKLKAINTTFRFQENRRSCMVLHENINEPKTKLTIENNQSEKT